MIYLDGIKLNELAAKDRRDENGQRLVVRNGRVPEREVVSGVGPMRVRQPRVRHQDEGRFSSAILPKYMRRAPSVDALIQLAVSVLQAQTPDASPAASPGSQHHSGYEHAWIWRKLNLTDAQLGVLRIQQQNEIIKAVLSPEQQRTWNEFQAKRESFLQTCRSESRA